MVTVRRAEAQAEAAVRAVAVRAVAVTAGRSTLTVTAAFRQIKQMNDHTLGDKPKE